ncbi:MAG: OB-fold protein [Novosphingobium sp.]
MIGTLGSGGKQAGSPSAQASGAVEPIATTARGLVQAYKANEAAAQSRFGNAPLLVSGSIHSIDLGMGDEPFLVLEGGELFSNPQAKLDEAGQAQAGTLTKGQNVQLLCQSVSEIIGTPMLENCALQP